MPGLRYILLISVTCCFCLAGIQAVAQNCPANIDFESGTFSGWVCYTGTAASVGGNNVITFDYSGGPVQNRHTMLSSNPGDGLDTYGHFPMNCPNGSGHSIKLGNDQAGTEAEGVSYDFIIPDTADVYNLIYHYAVVFQDPGHLPSEQPRMEIEIKNMTTNKVIYCSSFTFFANGTTLPGFELSDQSGGTPVWYKPWTAASINLDGQAGNHIRMFFKTADCTFRRHFGYAYIDVNTECSDKFVGANFCPDDTSVIVTAPYGYQSYTWYNTAFTQVLGTQQTLVFTPPPPAGLTIAVVLNPYDGYGCQDTLFTELMDTLKYQANAGSDKVYCQDNIFVQLGVPPKPGFLYTWTPTAGLNESQISNPLASPDTTTHYYLSVVHDGGGCRSNDTVLVKSTKVDNSIQLLGRKTWCLGSGDSTVLKVKPANSIQWFRDNASIPGATDTILRVTQTGTYYALIGDSLGCSKVTEPQQVSINSVPVVSFAVNTPNQCMLNNRFVFTNNSTNAVGEMQYLWRLGDGTTTTTRNVTYNYKSPGVYTVVLIVRSSDVCADSSRFIVNVYPNVNAGFTVDPVCTNLPVLPVNNTIEPSNTVTHYLWDFGNGNTSTLRNPPPQVYTAPGSYVMSLTVSTDQCPHPLSIQRRFVNVDAPKPGIVNPDQVGVVNLPLTLHARSIGDEVLWSPPVKLDNPRSYTPVFISDKEQTYFIQLKTKSGCITIDTQTVKLIKNIRIYVPNSFTPNKDGRNDVLRPVMYGIKQLNYFRVYNRWGQLVFETHDALKGWDGYQRSTPAEMQTLVWMLEAIGADNNVYKAKGSTILIR